MSKGPFDPRLLRYARRSRGLLVLIVVLAAVQVSATIGFAWFLTLAITSAVDGKSMDIVWSALGLLAVVVLVRAAIVWANERVSAIAAARVGSELRQSLVDAVERLGPGWLSRQNSASLTLTAGHGLEALDVYIGRFLPQLVASVIVTPVLLGVMWLADWPSGLTATLTLPLIPVFMVLIGLATRSVQNRQWATLQKLAARFSDTVHGLGTLRLYGRERRAVSAITEVTEDYRSRTMKVLRVTFLSGFALEFLASIAVAIIAVAIGLRLLDGDLTLAVGLFVLLLAPDAFLPLRNVGVQFHAATEGLTAMEDVFTVLDAAADTDTPAVSAETHPAPAAPAGMVLEVQELSVQRTSPLLPVTFTAAPGTVTVLRGPSGAGKSSVVAALRGAASFSGAALVNGTSVRNLSPASWLAWADQRPGLIAGTVGENVSLGEVNPDPDSIAWALRTACAELIAAERSLGVQGAGLSGGQAQRVAVARALYRARQQPSVIVLDEPSSALDSETEALLWTNLRRVADHGATIVLISHRESALSIADNVITITPAEVLL